jgi:Chaperone of endosialidase
MPQTFHQTIVLDMKISTILLLALFLPPGLLAQSFAINTDGSAANPSAILDVKSTDKGVLVPRMTLVQRASLPAPTQGLLVFQTDFPAGFYFFTGLAWVRLGTEQTGWSVTGNAAGATDFIGTTTDQPLNFRANNLAHARLTPRGALELGMNTSGNLFVGQNAGAATDLADPNVMSYPNTFIGHQAGQANTKGVANTFLGTLTGQANTTGSDNLFAGNEAGTANTTGVNNTFVGSGAGFSNTTAAGNVFVGRFAGRNITTGGGNVFLGSFAGNSTISGSDNIFVGHQAGFNNISGGQNHFVGHQAGFNNTTGVTNHFVGFQAGFGNTTGDANTFIGLRAGFNNTIGIANVFLGYLAGEANTTGNNNTFMGLQAGKANTTGSNNTFMGHAAGLANTTGMNNHFVGYFAGFNNTTGSNNTFLGDSAGVDNSTGSGNVFLGHKAGTGLNTTNWLVIDNNGTDPLITGNFGSGWVFNQANSPTWNIASDLRIKQNVQTLEGGLTTLLRLRPVRYEFTPEWVKAHPSLSGRAYVGVIAQEYRQVFPHDVKPTSDLLPGDPDPVLGVDMASAQIVAIRAIQELAAEVEALKKENAALKGKLGKTEKMESEMEEVKAKQAQTEAKLNEVLKLLQASGTAGK